MDACREILASAVVLGAGAWFVANCVMDALSDVKWWNEHDGN